MASHRTIVELIQTIQIYQITVTLTQRQSENGTVMMIRKIEMAVIRNAVKPGPSLSSEKEIQCDVVVTNSKSQNDFIDTCYMTVQFACVI